MTVLPPLPKAERIEAVQFCDDSYWFSADQMREYGEACMKAAVTNQEPVAWMMVNPTLLRRQEKLLKQALKVLEKYEFFLSPCKLTIAEIRNHLGVEE